MTDKTDILDDLWSWAAYGDLHVADERGFCELCSLRMPCDISEMVADLRRAGDVIMRLREANVKMSHQIDAYSHSLDAATTVVQIYGDKLIIDQITAVGAWPEQVEANLINEALADD